MHKKHDKFKYVPYLHGGIPGEKVGVLELERPTRFNRLGDVKDIFSSLDRRINLKPKIVLISPVTTPRGFDVPDKLYLKSDFRLWLKSQRETREGGSPNSTETVRSD